MKMGNLKIKFLFIRTYNHLNFLLSYSNGDGINPSTVELSENVILDEQEFGNTSTSFLQDFPEK